MNNDGRVIELEFENTRLKEQLAAAPDQQELQALKERMEDAQQSKQTYEVRTGRVGMQVNLNTSRAGGRVVELRFWSLEIHFNLV